MGLFVSSSVTATTPIGERAEATPDLWNTRYAAIDANVSTLAGWAANNAVYNVRDFLATGNGTTDDSSFILNATANGGRVFVPVGVYKIGTQISPVAGNLLIEGTGPNSILDFSDLTVGTSQGAINFVGLTGITVRNLKFRVTSGGHSTRAMCFRACSNVLLDNIDFEFSAGSIVAQAIKIDTNATTVTVAGFQVVNCRAKTAKGFIEVANAVSNVPTVGAVLQQIVIANNIVYGDNDQGAFGAIKIDVGCEGVSVHDNIIYGAGNINSAINVQDSVSRVSIRGNVVYNVTQGAILVTRDDDVSAINSEINVSGNVVDTCSNGIGLQGCKNIVVSGNTIANCTGSGITESQSGTAPIIIVGNTIRECQANGIITRSTGVLVMGNYVVSASAVKSYQAASGDAWVLSNRFQATDGSYASYTAGCVVRGNENSVTENSGTATVLNTTTSIAVTHGLSRTPTAQDVSVTPTNNLGTATKFWISGVGATQFTINVDADPGAGTATFAWRAVRLT